MTNRDTLAKNKLISAWSEYIANGGIPSSSDAKEAYALGVIGEAELAKYEKNKVHTRPIYLRGK